MCLGYGKNTLGKSLVGNIMAEIMNLDQADTMKGGFLQPTSDPLPANHGYKKIGILSGLGGEIFTYHFFIPQAASSYLEFVEQMREVEAALQTTFQ